MILRLRKGVLKKDKEENKVEIVLNMFNHGVDLDTISKYTNTDIERVKEITKKYVN